MLVKSVSNKTEINALVNLLDDPDRAVFSHVENKLLSLGVPVMPDLESAWEECFDPLRHSRIKNILRKIQLSSVTDNLKKWKNGKDQDILIGAVQVARIQYHDLEEELMRSLIAPIIKDVWVEMNERLTAFEKIRIINHVLFNNYGFRKDARIANSPQCFFINLLMESRKGDALSLSMLYLLITKALSLPVYSIKIPRQFILAYSDPENNYPENRQALFYINPSGRGAIISGRDIARYLEKQQIALKTSFFNPRSNTDIIKKLILNLYHSYKRIGNMTKAEEVAMITEDVFV